MFGNPMLDVAIGLVFFYLLLSIIVTVVQEFIASSLRLRNKNLLKAIGELIGKDNKQNFFEHPLIYPLFRGEVEDGKPAGHGPAYIPSRNFALAILDLQAQRDRAAPLAVAQPQVAAEREPAFDLARFFNNVAYGAGLNARLDRFDKTASEVIDKIGNPAVKQAATSALTSAVGELKTATDIVDTAVKELENLFDSSMDRAAGWYKVRAQRIALAISVVVAALLNADSIYVGQRLWGDEALRNQAVAAAEAYYESGQGQQQLTSLCRAKVTGEATLAGTAASAEAGNQTTQAGPPGTGVTAGTAGQGTTKTTAETGEPQLSYDQWQALKDCTEKEIKDAMDQLTAVGYPIGWRWESRSDEAKTEGGQQNKSDDAQTKNDEQNKDDKGFGIWKLRGQPNQSYWAILGIFLTGLAVSLGSSFWFDLLGKFMNVRMTGKREDTVTAPGRSSAGEASRTNSRPS
jgi:hypothetical protein